MGWTDTRIPLGPTSITGNSNNISSVIGYDQRIFGIPWQMLFMDRANDTLIAAPL